METTRMPILVWSAICLATVTATALFLHLRQSIAARRLPPGPRGWPVVGNIFNLGPMPHQTLANMKHKYGSVVWLRLGSVNTLAILSAEAAMEMFKNHDLSFCNRAVIDAMTVGNFNLGSITLSQYGPYWRLVKRLSATELFSRKRISETTQLRRRCADEMIRWISEEAKLNVITDNTRRGVEIAPFVFLFSLNLIGNLTLSWELVDPKSEAGAEFFQLVSRSIVEAGKPNVADFFPCLQRLDPQGRKRKMEKLFEHGFDIIHSFIKQRIEDGQARNKDFLDVLLKFKSNGMDEETKISEENINILIQEMFVGATDTSNRTIEWAMTELLRNPRVMKEVRAELDRVVGSSRKVEEGDIEELQYLQAVVKETLRLHAPVPFLLPRMAVEDTEFMGYLIPKGTQVFVNVWGIGRDANTWGEDALEFKPERFLRSSKSRNTDYNGQHYELIPFGAGRRMCAGYMLAHQVLNLVLGTLLHSFEWLLEDGVTPETLDMKETMGVVIRKAVPLRAIPKPIAH